MLVKNLGANFASLRAYALSGPTLAALLVVFGYLSKDALPTTYAAAEAWSSLVDQYIYEPLRSLLPQLNMGDGQKLLASYGGLVIYPAVFAVLFSGSDERKRKFDNSELAPYIPFADWNGNIRWSSVIFMFGFYGLLAFGPFELSNSNSVGLLLGLAALLVTIMLTLLIYKAHIFWASTASIITLVIIEGVARYF